LVTHQYPRNLQANGLYTILKLSFLFEPPRALDLVVETAPGLLHQLASPSDTAQQPSPLHDDLPFLPPWARLFYNSLLRNSFSTVNFPTNRSSFSTLSLRATSSLGSVLNLPRTYRRFQWYSRLDEMSYLQQTWASSPAPPSPAF